MALWRINSEQIGANENKAREFHDEAMPKESGAVEFVQQGASIYRKA